MQSLAPISEPTWVLSYNDKKAPDDLPPGYCVLIQNGFLDDNEIKERYGYSLLGLDTGEGKPNLALHPHETASHTQLLKINDNALGTAANLFYSTGGNWTMVAAPTFSPNKRYSLVTANGKTYITNGTDVVKSWNGVALVNVPSIPITKYLKWFHNFLWALNNSTFRSRAYFSNIGDPETFGASDFLDISPEDGDYITGANTLKDEFIIGKQYRLYSFQGWTEDTFQISVVNEKLAALGTIADESMINTGNDLHFLSYGGAIPHVHTIVRTRFAETNYGAQLTDAIEGTMKGLSKGQLSKAAGVFDGRLVWYFYPNGSSTFNDLAVTYDTKTKGFAKHTGIYAARACVSTVSGKAEIYFADSRDSKVYRFDTSNSDNGATIDFQFITRDFMPDFKRYMKFKYLFLEGQVGSTGNLLVYTRVDESDYDLQDTINLAAPSMVFPYVFPFTFGMSDVFSKRIELPYGVARKIRLKLAKNDTTDRTVISAYDFMGYRKSIRDLP